MARALDLLWRGASTSKTEVAPTLHGRCANVDVDQSSAGGGVLSHDDDGEQDLASSAIKNGDVCKEFLDRSALKIPAGLCPND